MALLTQLLEDWPYLAEQILIRLPLASLPALAATSRALRALVARQPESLWQASSVAVKLGQRHAHLMPRRTQAIASRELGAFHPAVQAASVQQWERARHSMFRRPHASQTFSRTAGCVSPDYKQLALLSQDDRTLLIEDLSGDLPTRRLALLCSSPTARTASTASTRAAGTSR